MDISLFASHTINGATSGALHAVTGVDHLGALLPICVNESCSKAWRIGAAWGLGHGVGVAILGFVAFFFKTRVSVFSSFTDWTEYLVGITLIIIGITGLTAGRSWKPRKDSHDERSSESVNVAVCTDELLNVSMRTDRAFQPRGPNCHFVTTERVRNDRAKRVFVGSFMTGMFRI
eukprot:GHVT01070676.1.p2 GENE.GHVT01070676.1~~GHVT01070676.1.p2  ORF type:complete len:175 (+),score=6.47 GHVT01070676.1:251-775(+)